MNDDTCIYHDEGNDINGSKMASVRVNKINSGTRHLFNYSIYLIVTPPYIRNKTLQEISLAGHMLTRSI